MWTASAAFADFDREGDAWNLEVEYPESAARYIVEKGSIAVDGISLTVASLRGSSVFSVAIIPHTFENTNLKAAKAGDPVNLEFDVLAKYVENLIKDPCNSQRLKKPSPRSRTAASIIIVDDEDRENEGDLMIAAEKVTPEAINFMATHGRGLICLPMTGQRLDELHIPLMVSDYSNTSSVRHGVLRLH